MTKRSTTKQLHTTQGDARLLLLVVLAISFVATLIPFGEFIIYPFRLFGTFVHETAHALAAVVTGGKVLGMNVNWDTSGLTKSAGGIRLIVSSAGYLGTVIAGAAMLMVARRSHRAPMALIAVGASVLLSTVAFAGYGFAVVPIMGLLLAVISFIQVRRHKRAGVAVTKWSIVGAGSLGATGIYLAVFGGLLTWAVGLLVGLLAIFVGAFANRVVAHGVLLFLAVQTSLDGLWSLRSLIFNIDHAHSDAMSMAQMTGVPALAWAISWAILGVVALLVALWVFWKDTNRRQASR